MSRLVTRFMATLVLASVMAATPACNSLPLDETRIENPLAAARGADQQAYALRDRRRHGSGLNRVREASAAFRAALETAAVKPT